MFSVDGPRIVRASAMDPAVGSVDKILRILSLPSRLAWNIESVQLTSELEPGGQGPV
jgi:hypothetical protein